jgi:hypothetical protein
MHMGGREGWVSRGLTGRPLRIAGGASGAGRKQQQDCEPQSMAGLLAAAVAHKDRKNRHTLTPSPDAVQQLHKQINVCLGEGVLHHLACRQCKQQCSITSIRRGEGRSSLNKSVAILPAGSQGGQGRAAITSGATPVW